MYKMEIEKFFSHTQYALPVGGVLILAILVFAFGFKSVAEPTFAKVAGEGKKKKQQQPQKQKAKAKKAAVVSNGSATAPEVQPKASPAKAAVKKGDSPKKGAVKADQPEVAPKAEKKATKQAQVKETKPADFDEGEWQAVNKKDKKKRQDGASISASPAASPAHQPASKKANKKKKPKMEEAKDVEPTKLVATEEIPAVKNEPAVVEPVNITPVEEKEKKIVETIVEKAPETKSNKEKNNNKPKPVEVAAPVSIPEAESEDQWQENKAAKKKKKARRE